jgi:hypothetical protein
VSAELALEEALPVSATRRGWIHSPSFDLAFFVLSPLLGFALAGLGAYYAVAVPLILAAVNYFIGVPHYLATFGFFCDGENRSYALQHRLLFVVVPLLICAAVAGLYATRNAHWVHSVLFVWNVWHVAAQSAGILSLYRKLSGGRMEERIWSQRFILCANAAMAFWFLDRFPPLWNLLVALHDGLPGLLRFGFAAGALLTGAVYALQVARRGFGLSAAEWAFLATSVLLFTPYLWVNDSNFATLAMLTGHFVQYLAIVWVLNRRKYGERREPPGVRLLAAFGRSWRVVALFMAGAALLFASFEHGTRQLQVAVVFMVAFNSLALVHFWVDGLIWAFRNPFIRRTVGPYLTLDAQRLR